MQYPACAQASLYRRALPALALVFSACVGEVIGAGDELSPGSGSASSLQHDTTGNGSSLSGAVSADGEPSDVAVNGAPSAAPSPATPSAPAATEPRPTADAAVPSEAEIVDGASAAPDAGSPAAPQTPEVPDISGCADALVWPVDASQWEREVLELTNRARAVGHDCGTSGKFGPAAPLVMEPHLRCSARLHSAYMARTGDFNHTQTSTGLDPFERIAATGYRARTAAENIAAGQPTPQAVVDGWLDSDGHCGNLMNGDYTQIGVGYALAGGGYRHYWTQNFGASF